MLLCVWFDFTCAGGQTSCTVPNPFLASLPLPPRWLSGLKQSTYFCKKIYFLSSSNKTITLLTLRVKKRFDLYIPEGPNQLSSSSEVTNQSLAKPVVKCQFSRTELCISLPVLHSWLVARPLTRRRVIFSFRLLTSCKENW